MIYRKYLFSIIAGGGFLLSACSSDILKETDPVICPEGKTHAVTFSVGLENMDLPTRLTNDGTDKISHIGKGEKIDRLIYAVYVKDEETGAYRLDSDDHPGQTILEADFSNNGRVSFTVDLNTETDYRIAFWAQNSHCDAYDTSDLTRVEVKYKDADGNDYANNDESRDAFCQIWTGSTSGDPAEYEEIEVVLKRPLAQINVGTTGADYKNILEGPDVFPHLKITHSRISVSGVARFLNVVDDKVLLQEDMASIGKESSEAFTDVTFDWSVIPAFMNMESIPQSGAELLQSDDEEYLRTDLDRDGNILGYLTSYPTLASDGNTALTETFKYLSMCYVLAAAGKTGNATYGNIKVGFAEDENGTNGSNTINLPNANGGRNYRTNILGGLAWVKDPDDPTPPDNPGPDDPTPPDNPGPDDPTPPDNPGPDDPTPPDNPGPDDPTPPDNPGPDDPTPPDNPGPDDPTPPDNPGPDDPTPPDNPGPDDPTPPDNPGPDDPTPPDEPAPSIFTRNVSIMIQTDFQGSETTDKDNDWSVTWSQNQ